MFSRISESPASKTAKQEILNNLPQAVPRSELLPPKYKGLTLERMQRYSNSDFLMMGKF